MSVTDSGRCGAWPTGCLTTPPKRDRKMRTFHPRGRLPPGLLLQVPGLLKCRSQGSPSPHWEPYSLAGGGGRGLPGVLPRMLQKLAEQLEVPFQLAHVHRGIVGGLLRGICRGQTDAPEATG